MPSKNFRRGAERTNALFLKIVRNQMTKEKAETGIKKSSSKAVDMASRVE